MMPEKFMEERTQAATREVSILLIEDDSLDVMAIQRALAKAKMANPLHVARDGLEAFEILRSKDDQQIRRPFIILLDLNMPRMNGLEFLSELRGDPRLRQSIVFVLTTSDDDQDIMDAYENLIAGYIVKQKVGEDFMRLIEMLDHYWPVIEFPIEVNA